MKAAFCIILGGASVETKKCNRCGEVKPLSQFYKNKDAKGGHLGICNTCCCAAAKVYRDKNREKVRLSLKVWRAKNKEMIAAYRKNYYIANRENEVLYAKSYRKANPETVAASLKKYREANPEKMRASFRTWRKANRDKRDKDVHLWKITNRDKICAIEARRRAKKTNAEGTASVEQIAARWDYYGSHCYICGASAEATDHVIPLNKNGSNWSANLRPICKRCNSIKRDSWPYDIEAARKQCNER